MRFSCVSGQSAYWMKPLNAAFSTNIRFKVQSPTNSLSYENEGNAVFYLGYDQGTSVTPRLNGLNATSSGDAFWFRIDREETNVLFSPATFRAPVIHGFKNFAVGDDGPFGSTYNMAFTSSQWELVSPFGKELPGSSTHELKNMSRVILRTVPFRDPAAPNPKDGEEDKTPPSCHMTVFRSAQGVFLPAISDNDEYQYWRIQKADGGRPGEPIKGGDDVRLSWRFADQSVGFRDYQDDVFGRRRNHCPPELSSTTLHLKVPWPRFESKNTPTGLVMSTQGTCDVVSEPLNVLPGRYDYMLQDLRLRIDPVESRGFGDSSDYMMRGLTQGVNETITTVTARGAKGPMLTVISMENVGVVQTNQVSAGYR